MPRKQRALKGRMIPCHHCGKDVYVGPARERRSLTFYCSLACSIGSYGGSLDPVEGFWMKVEKRGEDDCWPWKGQKRWDGYGRFVSKRKPIWAHRFSWELHNGKPIPEGMHVLHSCNNPECTNPKHLRIGTHGENMNDLHGKRRHPQQVAVP